MRPIIAAGFALALAVALSACQPQDPDGAVATPPADAPAAPAPPPALPAAFAGDIDAVGTEPFWSVSIRKDALTLSRPDDPDVAAAPGVPKIEAGKAVWTQAAGGKPLVVTLTIGPCTDGMSDRTFPLAAQVKFGDLTLDGCAARTGEAPKSQ